MVQQERDLEGWIVQFGVEAYGNRLTEHFAHQLIAQMAQVPLPDLFGLAALDELGEGRFDPIAQTPQALASLRRRIVLRGSEGRPEHQVVRRQVFGDQ